MKNRWFTIVLQQPLLQQNHRARVGPHHRGDPLRHVRLWKCQQTALMGQNHSSTLRANDQLTLGIAL